MAEISYKNIKEDLKFSELVYNDDFFTLKGNLIQNDDFVDYIDYEILKDVNDVKTNNYSNLIISKLDKNSNVLTPALKNINGNGNNIVSTLSFFNGSFNECWIAIEKSYNSINSDIDSSAFKLITKKPASYSNLIFNIVQDEENNECRISHNFGDITYYLSIKDNIFTFLAEKNDYNNFKYHLYKNSLCLYKVIDGQFKKIYCDYSGVTPRLAFKNYDGNENIEESQVINLSKEDTVFNYYIDNSWVKYDTSQYVSAIDDEHSDFSLTNQFLVHHEYNEDSSINIIPLKNNVSPQGFIINGDNDKQANKGETIIKPQVSFRHYSTINSGVNQELGSDNIILNFTFDDQEFIINEGDDCVFIIPEQKPSELNPLYPYERINVNDTSFIRCGAFGSDVPFFADKFKKYQNENATFNNATYLCTWLYNNPDTNEYIWMDRYYYPDMISRIGAENESFSASSSNIITFIYDESKYAEKNEKDRITALNKAFQHETFVDVESNVTITPGTTYKYSRISNAMVDELYDRIGVNRIDVVTDNNGNSVDLNSEMNLKRDTWRKIQHDKFNKTSAINLNFDIFLDPQKRIGLQLFGADYKAGFNIQNQKNLAPFHYYATKSHVYLLNNYFNIVRYSNISEKFGEEIKQFVLGDVFDNVILICKNGLIVLEYDLKIKTYVKYSEIGLDTFLGTTPYNTNDIGTLLSLTKPLMHNENLYVGLNTTNNCDVLKIVFNPETDDEKEEFANSTDETLVAYPRLLRKGIEYNNNFNVEDDNVAVETIKKIESLCIDFDGNLYAFNYRVNALSPDKDTIYGVYHATDSGDGWYHVFNQSIGKLATSASSSKFAEFSSDICIKFVALNGAYETALIRGFGRNSTTGITTKEEQALEIYDKTKTKIYNFPLKDFTAALALDSYSYIDKVGKEHNAFTFLGLKNNIVVSVTYISDEEKVFQSYIGNFDNILSTGEGTDKVYTLLETTNSNSIMLRNEENKLYFNLFIPSDNLYDNKITAEWDIKRIQRGWYNINVSVDLDEAEFIIKINDEVFYSYDNSDIFKKHTHDKSNIFNLSYYLGCIGKKYGDTLNNILTTDKADVYAISNTKIRNCTLYNKKLKLHEYQATRLKASGINPLVITLPCGVRNGVEEIVRYFKYNKPASISNKIKINIDGSGLKTNAEINHLKEVIKNALLSAGECITEIKDIEFN